MNKRNTVYTCVTNISDEAYIEAQQRADLVGTLKLSHRKKEANQIGCLGELIAEQWMDKNGIKYISQLKATTHDYLVNNSLTIDVKTKDRTVTARIDFDNTAPLYNHSHQRPDCFLFISLVRDKDDKRSDIRRFTSANIVGSISYNELDCIGIPFLKGEKDWRNLITFWTDCLNVEMWQLIPLKETIEIFKGKLNTPTKSAVVNRYIIEEMQKRIDNDDLKPRKLPSLH